MNPKNNPVNSINNFLNKNFGLPLPKSGGSTSLIGSFSAKPTNPTSIPNMSYAPTQNMSVPPSNTGATSPKPAAIVPPAKKSVLPPAGKTFVQNQIQPAYDTKTGLLTDYGRSQGMKEVNGPASGSENAPESPKTTPEAPKAESPYLTYLRSMFDPEALKTASSNLTTANTRLAEIQSETEKKSVAGRHASEDAFDASGGLKSGAIEASNAISRGTNRELADLATQESAAARSASVYKDTYDMLIGAGKSVFEAETAATKAAQDQSNKDRDFGISEKTLKLNEEKAAQDKLESDRNFAEDKRQFGLEYALKKQELANKTAEVTNTATGKDAEALSSMNLINTLLENPALGQITGIPNPFTVLTPGTGAALAKNQYNQVKGILALENRAKLKGQGAVSDFEGRTLERAASSLGRNLKDTDFVRELKQVRGAIATSHGLSADVLLVDPKTKQSMVVLSNSAGIAQAIKDGLTVEYQ